MSLRVRSVLLYTFLAAATASLLCCKPRTHNENAGVEEAAGTAEYFDRIESPRMLIELENAGLHFSEMLPGTMGIAANNLELMAKNDVYRGIVETIRQDIRTRMSVDPQLGPSQNYSHRTLDAGMLVSPEATLELTAVINRADLSLQFPNRCSTVRLLYRLAYRHNHNGRMDGTRLPLTFILNFTVPGGGSEACRSYLNKWRGQQSLPSLAGKDGPLNSTYLNFNNFHSLELNYQIQTWPSSVSPGMGAFGEYVLRVFEVPRSESAFRAVPKLLLNSIDVAKLKNDSALKEELKKFLIENAQSVARGTVNIPNKFLTKINTSYTPGALSRLSNRHFSQVFSASDFKTINFKNLNFVKSPEEFMVRLNDLTCTGCHSGRTANGFHLLGEDRPSSTHRFNQLFSGLSEHARAEKPYRVEILSALATGKPADKYELPISIKPPRGGAGYGSYCALGEASKAGGPFEGWTCKEGLVCQQTDEPSSEKHLGKCLPKTLGLAGDPCRLGHTEGSPSATHEKLVVKKELSCAKGHECAPITGPVNGGFPVGMCFAAKCTGLDAKSETCGPIAGDGFNACLANPSKTFVDCLGQNTIGAGLGKCDASRPCRNDYFCVKLKDTDRSGACVPGYFFFQLGVDAHPILATSGGGITRGFVTLKENEQALGLDESSGASELVLKRRPLSKSELAPNETCSLPKGLRVGVVRKGPVQNEHQALEVRYESKACPGFKGLVFVYAKHAKFY